VITIGTTNSSIIARSSEGMATEALTNAVRHSRAGSVRTWLGVIKGRAVVTIQDDGQGFEAQTLPPRAVLFTGSYC
jgi:signal transduction histidine kinase